MSIGKIRDRSSVLQVLAFGEQGPLCLCVLFKTLCLPYWLKCNRSVDIMLNKDLQVVLSPFPLFLSKLSSFLKDFPPTGLYTGIGWFWQHCRFSQWVAVIHSWVHITEKLVCWIDSVWFLLQVLILFTGRFVIVITLKKHFFFIWTLRLYRRRLFPIEVYSYQDVFLLFYK